MSILDYIKNLFNNGKKTANIYTKMLKKPYGDKQPLEIGLYGGKTPIPNEDVGIEINKKQYIRTTDENGVAKLNINLPVGEYSAKVYWRGNADYNKTTAYVDVIITTDTYMDGINLTKNEYDTTPYQCAVYRKDNNERIKENVSININGVSYVRSADNDGLYKLNINLNKGTYGLTANYDGSKVFNPSQVNNTITINEKPQSNKKEIILGCDANTDNDKAVQNAVASKLEQNGYKVEKLDIGPNYFASTDYSSKAKGKIGIYLIASGIFSIADAAYGSGQFDNYIFGIRGDFGDKGATNFDTPISADADCTSICDKLNGKTFNQMNAMLQPYVAVCGGASTDELANNILNWINTLDGKIEPTPSPTPQKSRSEKILDYFEEKFGRCEYIDDALEKIQGLGYSFYFSDGYNMYETIDRVANGEGANCFDIAEVLYHCAKGMNTKYGRDYQVWYLDVWCQVRGYDHIRLKLMSNGTVFYRDGACVLNGGDITDNWCGTSDNILEVNPDFIYDGD